MKTEEVKNIKEIEVVAETKKTKDGKPFTCFKAITKTGNKVSLHFRQKDEEGVNIVMPSGSCLMVIESKFLHLNKSKKYPELWVTAQPEYRDIPKKDNSAILDEEF